MFAFALDAARRIPGIRFIYRSHPILPPEELISEALSGGPAPENLEFSRDRSFEEDLMRCGSLLYRGSSTALYGILAGLKPFYVAREGELGIEPLYRLTHWKEMVRTPADFVEALSADMQSSDEYRAMQWAVAKDFASRYTMPEQETTLDALAELIQREES